jgi:hypothetical protein
MTDIALRLCDLATTHVGVGKLGPEHMGGIAEIDRNLPETCRYEGGALWRVITIDHKYAETLRAGEAVELDPRSYSCWSKSQAALMRILRHRHVAMEEGQELLLMRRDVSAGDKGIDIEDLFVELGLKDDGPSWHQYAGLEQEVLLRGGARITPEMVVGLWGPQDYEAGIPVAGERIDVSYEDVRKVDACIGLHNGGWLVTSGDETFHVVWDYGVLSGLPYDPEEEPNSQDSPEI